MCPEHNAVLINEDGTPVNPPPPDDNAYIVSSSSEVAVISILLSVALDGSISSDVDESERGENH